MNFSGKNVVKGIFWAALASAMWGISGTVLQLISHNLKVPEAWLLSARTLSSGVLLLVISALVYRRKIFDVFRSWRSVMWLVAYAVLGLMANLYTFYLAIQTGNSPAATILQYLAPLFIVVGGLFIGNRPLKTDIIAFVLALVGVVLALTKGNLRQLSISVTSLMWGLGSGLTAAFYVALPRPLVKDGNPPIVILGWGTMIAGILFNLYHPFWVQVPHLSLAVVGSIATTVIAGTVLPFSLLLYAAKFASSDVISIMDAVQPTVTSILCFLFLGVKLSLIEVGGMVLVVIGIYVLQRGRRQYEEKQLQQDAFDD